jgi:hypothetical protein
LFFQHTSDLISPHDMSHTCCHSPQARVGGERS